MSLQSAEEDQVMATRILGPKGSKKRRRFLFVPILLVACTALFYVSGALAVHDVGVFQLDGDAQTSLPSTPPAAEDWDLICKVNQVQAGTLAAGISATATSITVTETNGIAKLLPVNIQIGSEQMTVTARSGSANPFTYTVTRHIDGTTAAAHTLGDAVFTGCLFQKNYTPPAGTTGSNPHTFIVDQSNNTVDDILKAGTKDDNDIPSWSWNTAGSLDKNDLTDGAAAEYTCSDVSLTCGVGHGSDKLLYFMADRLGISGSANVAMWLFQKRVQQYADGTGISAGQCVTNSGCPFTTDGNAPNGIPAGQTGSNLATHVAGNCSLPGANPATCTHGDILVIGAFGPHASLNVFEYVGPNNATHDFNGTNSCFTAICSLQPIYTTTNGDCAAVGAPDNGCAVANTTVTASPWILPQKPIKGKNVNDQFNADVTHGLSTFVEGGLNLTGLGFGGVCFSSFLINSRASAAGDAELHDKLLGTFQHCAPNLTTQQSVTANQDGTPGTVQPGTAVTDRATITVTGATSPDDATGAVNFSLCGPVASIPVGTNVCDVSGVTIVGAGTNKPLNNANCSPVSPSSTDGISCALSDSVNGVGSELANGYYCFKATASLTNYDNPDPATNNTTECFQVLKLPTTIVTDPETGCPLACVTNTGPFNLKDTPTIYDHAVVTGGAGGGFPEGTVSFFICTPSEVVGGVCAQGAGTQVGSDVALTHVSGETIKSEATSAGYSITTSSDLGTYCFRAVYNSTSPQYDGVDDANTTTECFTVQNASSASSTQDWLPNDHVTITADAGSIAGTLSIQLIKGTLGATCAASTGTVKYTEPVPNSGAFTATSAGATYDTTNQSFKVDSSNAGDYYWRIIFTPTSSFAGGAVTKCETSSLTINNNP
jgi:hypothetical protein